MAGTLKGQNSLDVQKQNRSLIIRILNQKGITTRAEISELTGLNKATVTNIVNDLISWGAVREIGMSTGKSGRRTILIELIRENYAVIGAWLKRNEFISGVYDIQGNVFYEESVEFSRNDDNESILDVMCTQLARCVSEADEKKILGVAVALPGPYIKKEGKIALITGRKKWIEGDIEKELRSHLNQYIFTEHDANAATMAEWYQADKEDESANLMCIMVGHGVGGGVIEHGKLISGSLGTAGEIGHMSIRYDGRQCECGNFGCLETYCTIEALMDDVSKLLPKYPDSLCHKDKSFKGIVKAYHENDALALEAVNQIADYLGYGIVNAVNFTNPGQIIIGDELPASLGDAFLERVRKTVKNRLLPQIYDHMEIRLSTMDNSVLKGIVISLLDNVMDEPEKFRI